MGALGNCQLIPGMADFSQGVFHQSVGRGKKKKEEEEPKGTNIPQITLEIYNKRIIIMVPIERNDIFHPI